MSTTDVPSAMKAAQVRLNRVTPSHCRVVLDNPPLNLMGPEFVSQIREIVTALENDDRVKVVVFESAVDGFFLNHSDFLAKFEELTSIPQGPTGLEAWPDVLVRLTRAPFVSIALIRGRATGNGSELALACDMSFASREKALLSQFEVGVGLVAGGGPMARLPRVMGRGRALEVLLSADDIRGADAEFLGYVNRALPDAELDYFVDALATRIASFDKWAIANTKRLVNEASLPPDVEIRAGWDACMASVKRPAAQERIKALLEQGLQKPGDSENRLGFYVGQLGPNSAVNAGRLHRRTAVAGMHPRSPPQGWTIWLAVRARLGTQSPSCELPRRQPFDGQRNVIRWSSKRATYGSACAGS